MTELASKYDRDLADASKNQTTWIVTPDGLICGRVDAEDTAMNAMLLLRWAQALGLRTHSRRNDDLVYEGELKGWRIKVSGDVSLHRFGICITAHTPSHVDDATSAPVNSGS